jgi:hypothetical protein
MSSERIKPIFFSLMQRHFSANSNSVFFHVNGTLKQMSGQRKNGEGNEPSFDYLT